MMWVRRPPRPYAWKKRFAWWPTRIGNFYIWLQKYEVRLAPWRETRLHKEDDEIRVYLLYEFRTSKIVSAWRLQTFSRKFGILVDTDWMEAKPGMRLVTTEDVA